MAEQEFEETLSVLLTEHQKLTAGYDGEIRFLRQYAPALCSTEEQHRMMGEIDTLRKKLVSLEAKIWKLQHPDGQFD